MLTMRTINTNKPHQYKESINAKVLKKKKYLGIKPSKYA